MFSYLKFSQRSFILGLLTLGLMVTNLTTVKAQSQTNVISSKIPNQWGFKPPSNLGIPTQREAAATRGCKTKGDFFPLTPDPIKGLTVSANPTFYWYVPPTEAVAVDFSLRNDQDQELYQVRYTLTQKTNSGNISGTIMGVKLASLDNFSGLEVNKEYVWEVTLICDLNNPTQEKGVIGIVERINPTPEWENNVQNISGDAERLGLYIDANLWYETIDTMIKMHLQKPNDLEVKAAWHKLIESVNLPQISNTSIILE